MPQSCAVSGSAVPANAVTSRAWLPVMSERSISSFMPRRSPAVLLEQQQRAREVAHVARAEQHEGVRRTLHGAARAIVVHRVRGANDLDRQRVVAQHDVRESLRRGVVAAQRGHELGHDPRERRDVVCREDAAHVLVAAQSAGRVGGAAGIIGHEYRRRRSPFTDARPSPA